MKYPLLSSHSTRKKCHQHRPPFYTVAVWWCFCFLQLLSNPNSISLIAGVAGGPVQRQQQQQPSLVSAVNMVQQTIPELFPRLIKPIPGCLSLSPPLPCPAGIYAALWLLDSRRRSLEHRSFVQWIGSQRCFKKCPAVWRTASDRGVRWGDISSEWMIIAISICQRFSYSCCYSLYS